MTKPRRSKSGPGGKNKGHRRQLEQPPEDFAAQDAHVRRLGTSWGAWMRGLAREALATGK